MAASNLNLGKASGGVLNVQPADGTTTTSIVLPASGTVTTNEYVNSNNLGNGSTTFNGLGGSGFKNYIINGGFDVNQRTISLTDGYQIDRWLITGTHQLASLFLGNLNGETVNNKALVFTKSGSGITYYQQRIEFPRRLAGKTVTVSFKAYSNVTMTGNVYFDAYNPTDGYTTAVTVQSFSWGQSWNKLSFTFTLPSLGTNYDNSNSYISLVIANTGTTTGAYLGEVQLEEGSVATPFEQRAYGLELSLCQRYYETGSVDSLGYGLASGFVGQTVGFKVTKRVDPTITQTSYYVSNCSSTPVNGSVSVNSFRTNRTVTVSGNYEFAEIWTASAEL